MDLQHSNILWILNCGLPIIKGNNLLPKRIFSLKIFEFAPMRLCSLKIFEFAPMRLCSLKDFL